MAYDQFIYPQEQPGYQPPPTPDMSGFWPWLSGGFDPYADFGGAMAQRMATSTPDYPLGQGFLPTPDPAPQFDPSMVANPGLGFPQGPPQGPPQVQQNQMGPQMGPQPDQPAMNTHPRPGGEPAMNTHPAPFPYEPPPGPPGMEPSGGLAGAGLQGGPSPMQNWMTDYNQQTDAFVAAQQEQAKNAMWIQMGQALLANIGDPAMGLAGVGQAVAQHGANEPAMEQYKQGRESERLDLLYKMEQIRSSQAPREFRDPVVKNIKLDDNTFVEIYPESYGEKRYKYEGEFMTQSEFNTVSRGAAQRATDEKVNERRAAESEQRETQIQNLMRTQDMTREQAETFADMGAPMGKGAPGQREVIDPKALLAAQREELMRDPEMRAAIEHMSEEQFAAFMEAIESGE